MSSELPLFLDERTQNAVRELEGTIRQHYPTATFELSRAVDDPAGIHLITTVDVDDPDEVGDLVIDRVVELQVEERIPLHVIPVRPLERVLAELKKRPERPLPRLPRLDEPVFTPRGPGATLPMTVVLKQKRKRGRPRLGQEPSIAVSLRLDQASVAKLRQVAQARGIGPTTLLRRWVLEHLQASENEAKYP